MPPIPTDKIVTGTLKNITIPLGTTTSAQATQNVTLQGNLDASGTPASGASILETPAPYHRRRRAAAPTGTSLLTSVATVAAPGTALFAAGDVLTLQGQRGGADLTPQTFTVTATSTVNRPELTFYNQSLGIDTTVTGTPPPGAAHPGRSDQSAMPSEISITGNTGNGKRAGDLQQRIRQIRTGSAPCRSRTGQNAAGTKSNPAGESVHTSLVAYDSLGTPVNVDVTAVLQSQSSTGNTWRSTRIPPDNQGGNRHAGRAGHSHVRQQRKTGRQHAAPISPSTAPAPARPRHCRST